MASRYRKFIYLLCMLACAAQADIYQWTDDRGNVHYADKPVDNASAVAITVESRANSDYAAIRERTPIYYQDRNQRALPVAILPPQYDMDRANNTRKQIVRLMFGHNCVSPMPIRYDEFRLWRNDPLASGTLLAARIKKSFQHASYTPIPVASEHALHKQNDDALLLIPKISDLNIEACATEVTVMNAMNRYALEEKRYQRYSYPRARVYMKLDWELHNRDRSDVLYTGFTEAYVDNESVSMGRLTLQEMVLSALERATHNLLADEQFVKHMRPASVDRLQTNTISPEHESSQAEATDDFSLIGSLDNFTGGYLQAAKLSKAMVIMASIKIPVSDYYARHGEMPLDLKTIDVSIPPHILQDNYIQSLRLKHAGIIQAQLTGEFGQNAILELSPEPVDSIGLINWTCYANLQQQVLDKLSCKSR